jgi:FSR family fosmidomycin resistance protein-like MFS transporter
MARRLRRPSAFVALVLAIEFLDELTFGAREAAWPGIQDDLSLSYVQIGLLLSVPNYVAIGVEPVLFILGDVWKRRLIVLGGGLAFAAASMLTALSQSFWPLLATQVLFYPASGAFVSLSQASLMDHAPARREQNMARWELAGSVGVLGGTLGIGALVIMGAGWRPAFYLCGGLALCLALLLARLKTFPQSGQEAVTGPRELARTVLSGFGEAVRTLRRWSVLRWLVLVDLADLMGDVLLGYLALYLVGAGEATEAQAAFGVAVWTVAGLAGDIFIIPLFERVPGTTWVRLTAVLKLAVFPALLLAPELWMKMCLLAVAGATSAGWYAVLQAKLFDAMPGKSGTAIALNSFSSLLAGVFPLAIGAAAAAWGIGGAMWLLMFGPVALIIGLPRRGDKPAPAPEARGGEPP